MKAFLFILSIASGVATMSLQSTNQAIGGAALCIALAIVAASEK